MVWAGSQPPTPHPKQQFLSAAAAVGVISRATRRRLQEEEERLDRFSLLPDAVLGDIISFLPTADAARTQILSSRWRHLWRSAPLNLDDRSLPYHNYRFLSNAISRVLSAHPGPARRLALSSIDGADCTAAFDGWLRSPVLASIQELEFRWKFNSPLRSLPPAAALRFMSTLRAASFGYCQIPTDTARSLRFPQLEQLTLDNVLISETALHALLAACPVLENLLLSHSYGFRCVRISSPSLRNMGVRACWGPLDLRVIIEDAPCLERLLHLNDGSDRLGILLVAAPKLKILGCTSRLELGTSAFEGLHAASSMTPILGASAFEGLHAASLMTPMRNVRVLALTIHGLSLDVVIDFMRCFPCLEKLHMKSFGLGKKDVWPRADHIECLNFHLKKTVVSNYRGVMRHVKFATFFVLNARVLELMMFGIDPPNLKNYSESWIVDQHHQLHLENRASRGAHFDFTDGWRLDKFNSIKNARDL